MFKLSLLRPVKFLYTFPVVCFLCIVVPVPYASLGERRYVVPKPFSSKYAKVAHVRTSPYLDAVR